MIMTTTMIMLEQCDDNVNYFDDGNDEDDEFDYGVDALNHNDGD